MSILGGVWGVGGGGTPTVLVAASDNNTFPIPIYKNPEHYKLENARR